mgnify:CR=1 FL=1
MPLKILSKDVDATGTDIYRDDNATIPLMYRATVTESIKANASGTNNNVNVHVKVPVITTVNGITTSTNSFNCNIKFTALQNVVADTERVRALDVAIEYLNARKTTLVQGILPPTAVTLTK